ncbi:Protein-L-isoaspartate O-methyltransferase [Aphelenchoides besseyi]|nr:Protein-L-isoaspartate O-methyltransferase [Aphelenchoides besseyi]KAI6198516.1 Protein-L-isoaspartate O-methyltransferase [Aphelenchoides besseyi]
MTLSDIISTTRFKSLSLLTTFSFSMISWVSGGKTNFNLIDQLQKSGVFNADVVRQVMMSVDRADFTASNPYQDSPQTIGFGATISAPHMHAMALEGLVDVIKPNSRILDVGCGSGYLTTCFAKMVGENGSVVGIDHIDELVQMSERNIRKHNADLLDTKKIELIVGDGRKGFSGKAPYDAIHVGAAAAEMPQDLVDQLAIGGRMLIPVGRANQEFLAVEKQSDGFIRKRTLAHVIYVPLTDSEKQFQRN